MDLPLDEIEEINFNRKKIPISPELRPIYRISQIILVMELSSTMKTASLLKLQLFNWGLQNEERYERLFKLKETKDFPIIRFDPFLNRALNYGVAMQVFSFNVKTGKFSLTEKGELLAQKILKGDVFSKEKVFLKTIKKSLSDKYILQLFKERYPS
ncbi:MULTISPECIES: hypothetical protein [Bacillus]|uniref:hypothetical protein n=1 Tax=Bacillus TaxID=1386 RepID=UPI0005519740|nr:MULTISPECIES: hypothetical protein [Bacillus]KMK99452.1 hypothetical protein VL05_17345 [Bacillus stratosphericus]MDH8712325.1 hypothetical protein [Micromonospora sp. 1209]BAT47291.1 uncharacterized protein BTUAT1_01570 [Bacillus pumilus]AKC64629.1 hypothetical protein VT48_00715 [Bacillus altitudinis]APP14867.1 hypothetical protein BS467_03535 [Bacillus altitudinis]